MKHVRLGKLKEIEQYGYRLQDDENPDDIALIAGERFISSWKEPEFIDDYFISKALTTAYQAGFDSGVEDTQKVIRKSLGL